MTFYIFWLFQIFFYSLDLESGFTQHNYFFHNTFNIQFFKYFLWLDVELKFYTK